VRRLLVTMVAGLVPALWLASASATERLGGAKIQPDEGASCGTFGTSVQFVKSPKDAAKQALKETKLVFVLHVSGDFEDPDFT